MWTQRSLGENFWASTRPKHCLPWGTMTLKVLQKFSMNDALTSIHLSVSEDEGYLQLSAGQRDLIQQTTSEHTKACEQFPRERKLLDFKTSPSVKLQFSKAWTLTELQTPNNEASWGSCRLWRIFWLVQNPELKTGELVSPAYCFCKGTKCYGIKTCFFIIHSKRPKLWHLFINALTSHKYGQMRLQSITKLCPKR